MEMACDSLSVYGNEELNDLCEEKWQSSSGCMFIAGFIDIYLTKLPNRWLVIKTLLIRAAKIENTSIAFGKLHLAPFLASSVAMFLTNPKLRCSRHPQEGVHQMEWPMSV